MAETRIAQPELPNIVAIVADKLGASGVLHRLPWLEGAIFSLIAIAVISLACLLASRRPSIIPGRLQCALELFAGGFDEFVRGILGPRGKTFTPFIGTLFIYILTMNIMSIVPFMKAPTTSWSTTLALALCVFAYLQYTAIKELGLRGYVDHLLGRPRGILAVTAVIPLLMFFLHIIGELIRPISLSLRLRSNIWGDDILLAVLAGFGMKGVPLLLFNMLLALLAAIVQACVFCLLTTIYFALLLSHENEKEVSHGL